MVIHTALVRSIRCYDESFCRAGVLGEMWEALLRHAPQPMFPKVNSLQRSFVIGPWARTQLFMAPQLRCVRLAPPYYDTVPPFEEFIMALGRTSYHLEQLILIDEFNKRSIPRGQILRLAHFPHLTVFNAPFTVIGPEALRTLSVLPCLRVFNAAVRGSQFNDWDMLPQRRTPEFFAALITLNINCSSLEWVIAFLNVIASSHLQTVGIATGKLDENEDGLPLVLPMLLRSFCCALSDHPSCGSIKEISISIDGEHPPPHVVMVNGKEKVDLPQHPATFLYRSSSITPLLHLSSLRELVIESWCDVYPSDIFLSRASQAWPDLRKLELTRISRFKRWGYGTLPDFQWQYRPRATLTGLMPLIRRCRHLVSLSLYVDADVLLPDPKTPAQYRALYGEWPSKSIVRCFDIGMSQTSQPVRVAAFLSDLCPDLEVLRCYSYHALSEEWSEVMALLVQFRAIRSQERQWMKKLNPATQGLKG